MAQLLGAQTAIPGDLYIPSTNIKQLKCLQLQFQGDPVPLILMV